VTRLVVTGSQGFVGKHLRRVLTERGVEVVGVDRPGTGAEREADLSARGLDVPAMVRDIGRVDGVIYMAATITRGSSVDAAARDNLEAIATRAVEWLETSQGVSPGAPFVYCSTYKTYGPARTLPIDPQRPPQKPDPHSYGCAKKLAERLLANAAARCGARWSIVRPTCIYGPGQHLHNAIPTFLRACWAGEAPTVFGTGRDVRDDVFAPDLARALMEACLRGADGAFHAGGERPTTILEVAEACCRVVESLGGPAGLTPRLDPSRPPKWWLDQTFDLRRSREILGYVPTPLATGLALEATWIREGAR
jgi:UDP-glucose 4-epimerase